VLALKNTSCPEMFHCIEIFSSSRIFEQLVLALNSLYSIYIFYLSRFFEQLALALKAGFAVNSQY